MPPTAQAEAGPRPAETPPSRPAAGPHPFWGGIGSGLLLWASFPPADWGWLAWGALVPLFAMVPSHRRALSLYVASWVGGLVFWLPTIQWLRLTDATAWLAWVVMALALSLFWPAFLLLARWLSLRHRLPLMLAAPIPWIALEYARAYAVSGFPWYYLAHSQHRAIPLIQVADITGSLGISLVVAVVNAWLVDLLTLPLLRPTPAGPRPTARQAVRLATVASLLVAMIGYGAYRLGTSHFREGPRVALIQSNLPQRLKMGGDPNEIVILYRALVERALRGPAKPDLIVWPETSFPFSVARIADDVSAESLEQQAKRISPALTGRDWRERASRVASLLQGWTDGSGVPMVVGAIAYDHRPEGYRKYNGALLFRPSDPIGSAYYKMHLVPFGEYVPLIQTFPWLAALTPYDPDNVPTLDFGAGPVWFDIGPHRFATAICFEDTVPQVVRRLIADVPDGRRPEVLLNLSNDGWFVDQRPDGTLHKSSEHEMHLIVSRFRAIEHRTPLARSANTGISAIVDGNGRVVDALETLKEGVVVGPVPLDDRRALYTEWGDWLGQSAVAVLVGLVPLGWLRRRPAEKPEC